MNFRKNQLLQVTAQGAFTGALVRFVRKNRNTNYITVSLVQDLRAMLKGTEIVLSHGDVAPGKMPAKSQGSRLIKIVCWCTGEQFILRGTDYALGNFGLPLCPACKKPMEREDADEHRNLDA